MKDRIRRTATGAGTEAGDSLDQQTDTGSRAAEAVEDKRLASVQTTGPAPKGVNAAPDAPEGEAPPAEPRPTQHDYSDRPRQDLERNQAGIGSRLDKKGY